MLFSSLEFVFLFLPLVFAGYWLLVRFHFMEASKWWLVATSLYFYYAGTGRFAGIFILSVLFNYAFGQYLAHGVGKISKRRRQAWLLVGVLVNVITLGYYKYVDFLIYNYNAITGAQVAYLGIPLPIGISFFTFQLIAFLVDSYRGDTKDYSLLNYLIFITFFPQLVVGPIVHHTEIVTQLEQERIYRINSENLAKGMYLFILGGAKKILIADNLTPLAYQAFERANELNMLESWAASFSYTVSYYFDLSGYADMAIGLGLMFNLNLPLNFNSPYRSRDFAEYWRRWHITLSRFLGNYIFRNVYKKGASSSRFYFAVMVTFFVSGFWHGAGWTFVVWGLLNGLFVVMAHAMTRAGKEMPALLAWLLTFAGVVMTRILFVSKSFSDAIYVMVTHFDLGKLVWEGNSFLGTKQVLLIAVGMLIATVGPNSNELVARFSPDVKTYLVTTILLVALLLNMDNVQQFLYFQF